MPPDAARARPPAARGLAWGLLGVVAVSVTLPATRIAVAALDPVFVGLGRAVGHLLGAGAVRTAPHGAAALALGNAAQAPPSAWLAFAYVSAVSMYLGFFAWYRWHRRGRPDAAAATVLDHRVLGLAP